MLETDGKCRYVQLLSAGEDQHLAPLTLGSPSASPGTPKEVLDLRSPCVVDSADGLHKPVACEACPLGCIIIWDMRLQ